MEGELYRNQGGGEYVLDWTVSDGIERHVGHERHTDGVMSMVKPVEDCDRP